METQQTCRIRRLKLAGVLAERAKPFYMLAAEVGISPATLSQMLHGHRPTPSSLAQRIEKELGLEPGALVEPTT